MLWVKEEIDINIFRIFEVGNYYIYKKGKRKRRRDILLVCLCKYSFLGKIIRFFIY